MPVPVYQSQVAAPEPRGFAVQPAAPQVDGGFGIVADAGARLGAAISGFAGHLAEAQDETRRAQNLTDFLTKSDALADKYKLDTDFHSAPKKFADELAVLEKNALDGIQSDQRRAEMQLQLRRLSIAAQGKIDAAALTRETDANVAALDSQELQLGNRAAAAATPVERAAILRQYQESTAQAQRAGWISAEAAFARNMRFVRQVDTADLARLSSDDPIRARQLLSDPQAFGSLDPVQREHWRKVIDTAADKQATDDLVNRARWKPEIASLQLGQVVDPRHADAIFVQGIIPTESGGRDDVVSNKGALGRSQILPDTARDMAKALGKNDVAALDDAALRRRMIADPQLNQELGGAYFRQQLARYEGSVPLALAAYNAGPARADKWRDAAMAKFGGHPSPGEIASVIDLAETRDYVAKVYGQMGADLAGPALSDGARLDAARKVGAVLDHQAAIEDAGVKQLASATRAQDDVVDLLKDGYDVSGGRIARVRTAQEAAARRGDLAAAEYLRKLDFQVAAAPYVRQAWTMPIAALDGEVKRMEAELTRPGADASSGQALMLKAFRAVRDEMANRRNTEPVMLGERAGYYSVSPIDPKSAPDDPAFGEALAVRGRQADLSRQVYGGSAAALTAEEAKAFKERYDQAGAGERFGLIETMGRALPESALADTLQQFTGKNAASAAMIARLARTRPALAREIFDGHEMLGRLDAAKLVDVRSALADTVGRMIYPSAQMQQAVVEAAQALYVARRNGTGDLYGAPDQAAMREAVEAVTGKLIRRNGATVPVTPGLEQDFATMLDGLNAGDIAAMGGAVDRAGRDFDPAWLGRHVVLQQLQPGGSRYVAMLPSADGKGAPVMTKGDLQAGEVPGPLVIDMQVLAERWRADPKREGTLSRGLRLGVEQMAP